MKRNCFKKSNLSYWPTESDYAGKQGNVNWTYKFTKQSFNSDHKANNNNKQTNNNNNKQQQQTTTTNNNNKQQQQNNNKQEINFINI